MKIKNCLDWLYHRKYLLRNGISTIYKIKYYNCCLLRYHIVSAGNSVGKVKWNIIIKTQPTQTVGYQGLI